MNAHKDKRTPSQPKPLEPGTVICLKPAILDLEPVSLGDVRRSIQALNDGLQLRYYRALDHGDVAADAVDPEPPKDAS
jgi:hypothetical protein